MGFWRGLGYLINIVWIIACLIFPYGLFIIWLPIIFLYVLHKGAKREQRHKETIQAIKDKQEKFEN